MQCHSSKTSASEGRRHHWSAWFFSFFGKDHSGDTHDRAILQKMSYKHRLKHLSWGNCYKWEMVQVRIDHRQAIYSKAKLWLLFKVSCCTSCSLWVGWSHSGDSVECQPNSLPSISTPFAVIRISHVTSPVLQVLSFPDCVEIQAPRQCMALPAYSHEIWKHDVTRWGVFSPLNRNWGCTCPWEGVKWKKAKGKC